MAFEIKDPPEFTLDVPQWTKQTRANGEEMAKVIEKLLNNEVFLKRKKSRVLIGSENTGLEESDTLFVVDESESLFRGVSYTNMTFGAAASGNELWAQVGGEARESEENELGIVEGKLSVSEHPAPDADFFAKIND